MQVIKIGYWALAVLTATGWATYLSAEIALATGNAGAVIWLAEMTGRLDRYASWFGIVVFAAFTLAVSALGPYRWKTRLRSFWVTMRGAPRWLVMGMIATVIFTAIRLACALLVPLSLPVSNAGSLPASLMGGLFAFVCCHFVSAARLGLGEQHCENGHPLGRDMMRCSLCGARAKGLLLFKD